MEFINSNRYILIIKKSLCLETLLEVSIRGSFNIIQTAML